MFRKALIMAFVLWHSSTYAQSNYNDSLLFIEAQFIKDANYIKNYFISQMEEAISRVTKLAMEKDRKKYSEMQKKTLRDVPLLGKSTSFNINNVNSGNLLGRIDTIKNVFEAGRRYNIAKKGVAYTTAKIRILKEQELEIERSPKFINFLVESSHKAGKDFLKMYLDAKSDNEKDSVFNEAKKYVKP